MKPSRQIATTDLRFKAQCCLVIVLLGILVYGNHLKNPFQFDSVAHIANNPYLQNPTEMLEPQFWVQRFNSRGLLQASFAWNTYLDGFQPFGYHIINLTLHLINTLLVFFATGKACRYFKLDLQCLNQAGMRLVSLFTALLFLLHPIQTESVIYVTSRSEVFSATFYLTAFLIYQSFLEQNKTSSFAAKLLMVFILAVILFMGFSVKQTLVTLPVILILYHLCGCPQNSQAIQFLKKWKWAVGMSILLVLGTLAVKLFTDEHFLIGPSEAGEIIGRKNYMLSQPGVLVFYYLKQLALPFNLNIDPDIPMVTGIFSLRLWLALGVIGYLTYRTAVLRETRIYFFLACWFFIVISPSSSIVTLHDLAAEHRVYLASYAFYFVFVLGLFALAEKFIRLNKNGKISIVLGTLIFVSAVLSVTTISRNAVWKNELTLWEDTFRKSPNKVRPMINLARAHSLARNTEQAIYYYEKSLQLMPGDFVANYNLGDLYLKKGITEKALRLFQSAHQADPKIAEAPAKLGEIYLQLKQYEKADWYLKKSVELNPGFAASFRNLGILNYFHLGDPKQGIAYFMKSLHLDPNQPDTQSIRLLINSQSAGKK